MIRKPAKNIAVTQRAGTRHANKQPHSPRTSGTATPTRTHHTNQRAQ